MSNVYAAIVLCGGRSSRMGTPKALLPFGPELMLQRVVRQFEPATIHAFRMHVLEGVDAKVTVGSREISLSEIVGLKN